MPLFVCDKCKAIENTALGLYTAKEDYGKPNQALCSECMPYKKYVVGEKVIEEGGKWHGEFPKEIATTESIKEIGETNFIYVADILDVKAKNPCVL